MTRRRVTGTAIAAAFVPPDPEVSPFISSFRNFVLEVIKVVDRFVDDCPGYFVPEASRFLFVIELDVGGVCIKYR